MNQTLALLLDAYRELNAKKLFWITLVLSAVVAGSFFLIGINENGLKVIVWDIDESAMGISTNTIDKANFYKIIFSSVGIRYWLGIAAAVLAIISTASIFPDTMKPGSIDLLLTKPISRVRLFLTRYTLGLGFAFLQVLVFTTICFFVIGMRGGAWEPGLFLAVPFFVLFFSYLFALSVFIGVLTRSTIAALLITLVFFALLIGLNTADMLIRTIDFGGRAQAAILEEHLKYAESLKPEQVPAFEEKYGMTIDELRQDATNARASADSFSGVATTFTVIKTPLPKTGETLGMLTRVIVDAADLPEPEADQSIGNKDFHNDQVRSNSEIIQEQAETFDRPGWWVIGTSLGFEFVLLGLAGWKFCRRDY